MAEAIAELEKIVSEELGKGVQSWAEAPLRSGNEVELPEWYQEFRDQNWKSFCDLPNHGRTDEAWRFSNLKLSKFSGLHLASALDDDQAQALVERSTGAGKNSARIVFVNNVLVAQELDGLPDGVVCLSMNEALAKHGDKVRESFMKEEAQLGGKKFAALHGSGELSGVFIYVPDGVKVEQPVEVFHWLGGENNSVILPHTLIVTGADAEVSLVDHYRSIDDKSTGLSLGMSDIVTGENSRVNYLGVQRLNTGSKQVQIGSTKVGKGVTVKTALVNLGAAWVRNENISRMTGAGSRSDMLSLNLATGADEVDQRTKQLHEVENTESDLFYKNALYDKSRTIFDGLILVKSGAHHTDAFQTCRNLLNSEEAEANSMPGLEIDADQVRCSHGSTAGPIDTEQLFYCAARGIPKEAARKLISFGFLHDVIERLDGDVLKGLVNSELEAAFSKMVG